MAVCAELNIFCSGTTLFTNSTRAGWILAGSSAGLVAQFWSYHAVFYAAFAMVIGSVFCIWRVKNVDEKPADVESNVA